MIDQFFAFLQVVAIDLVLAGDNAIVVGMAAAGLPESQRRKAVLLGIGAAAVLRIIFAVFTVQLLAIIGLTLAGGLLLLWVAWKLGREIMQTRRQAAHMGGSSSGPKSFGRALLQIVVADVSMSLDNVLAVAGAARDHVVILIVGLALSVALMGAAATVIARLLTRHFWIAYVGLVVIAYVAFNMIWDGGWEVMHAAEKARMF
ncbi:MAG: TerC family protein [Alphaproteobacteria bacterium]